MESTASQRELAEYIEHCKLNRDNGLGLFSPQCDVPRPMIVAALIYYKGKVARIADKFNLTTATLRRYIKDDPILEEIVESYDELRVEEAEYALDKVFNENGEEAVAAAKFLLGTKGKRRGYTEKVEVDNKVVKFIIDKKEHKKK